jgi:hypothetical protein
VEELQCPSCPLNPRADLASSLNDVRHRFVFNTVWDSTPYAARKYLDG